MDPLAGVRRDRLSDVDLPVLVPGPARRSGALRFRKAVDRTGHRLYRYRAHVSDELEAGILPPRFTKSAQLN